VTDGGISGVVSKAKQSVGLEAPGASESEAVRTVHGALRAIGEGDWEGFARALKEDVEWVAPGGDFPGGANLSGRDAVKEEFVGAIERTYATFGFVPDSLVAAPHDEVIVFGSFECEGRKGGKRVDEGGVMVWKMDGEEATEVRVYTDSAPFPEAMSEDDERELESEAKEKDQEQGSEREGSDDDEGDGSDDDEDEEDGSDDDSDSDERGSGSKSES
jgi:ketosteroid isomerase-like protein